MAISIAERAYLEDGVVQGFRGDGRGSLDCRPLSLDVGLIPSANGSSRVMSDGADIITCVKCTMGSPPVHSLDEGTVTLNVDCAGSHMVGLSKRGSEDISSFLSSIITSLCLGAHVINYKQLCVEKGELAWHVSIDVIVLMSGGNLIDMISLGVKAALLDTKLPLIELMDEENEEGESKLLFEVDEREEEAQHFPCSNVPVCVSVGLICGRCVLDMSAEEEKCSDACVTVAVNESGNAVGVHRAGRRPIEMGALLTITKSAESTGVKKQDKLKEAYGKLTSLAPLT
eukprot:GHVN01021477.1.p1 GENE.GHVN01021477.1~~GHVN01021477.1.p1  ORF type:complete len:286 (-),score=62.36 GHVN01021477.1:275-1132(-)